MKYALALLPLYLNCTPSIPQAPVVEQIEPSIMVQEDEVVNVRENPSSKQVARLVIDSFRQIIRQANTKSLGGVLRFDNETTSVDYNYDTSPFCDMDTRQKFEGKITFEYSRIEGITEYRTTTVILTDVPPFGSVDKIELRIDRTKNGRVERPLYGAYNVDYKAQAFYDILMNKIGKELESHQAQYHNWNNFPYTKTAIDEEGKVNYFYNKVMKMVADTEPISIRKIHIYNPCDSP